MAGILCSLEKSIVFTNTTTPTVYDGATVSETDTCFGAGGQDINNDGDTTDTITVSIREAALTGGDFDQKIEMQLDDATYNPAGTNDIVLHTNDSADTVAAKAYQAGSVTEAVTRKTNGEGDNG